MAGAFRAGREDATARVGAQLEIQLPGYVNFATEAGRSCS